MAVHVRIESESLDPADLRNLIDVSNCGSVVSFVGLTRGIEEGWKFSCDKFDINIDNGLYFGNKNSYKENQNIFISGMRAQVLC